MNRKYQLIGAFIPVFVCVMCFNSCKDINDVEAVEKKVEIVPVPEVAPPPPPPPPPPPTPVVPIVEYPFNRMISDVDGRSIDVKILAKSADEIGMKKIGSFSAFILPLNRLSDADQVYLNSINHGGDIEAVRALVDLNERLADRVASWNSQFYNAGNESANLGIPLLTVFLINDDPQSDSIERNVLFSNEFRTWANQNLALCLVKLDSTKSRKVSSISAGDNRLIASRFGVTDEVSYVLSIPDHPSVLVDSKGIISPGDAIMAIIEVMNNPSMAKETSEIPVPEKTPGEGAGKGGKGGKGK